MTTISTPGTGFGVAPFGVGPYGIGTPAQAPVPSGGINRTVDGKTQGSLAISIVSGTAGQYVFDEFGRRRGMPDAHHMIVLAIKTLRGSCAVEDIGNSFFEVRTITDSFVQEQKVRVYEAFKFAVDNGYVRIDTIDVEPNGGSPALTHVRMTDLIRQVSIEVTI